MRRIIRALYWKVVRVIARITRSVEAINEGYTPPGSESTGPKQPLVSLRDSVGLLGATAGRLEARLDGLAAGSADVVDRLLLSFALTECTATPAPARIVVAGDDPASPLARDLAELGYDVVLLDAAPPAWVAAASSSDVEIGADDLLVLIERDVVAGRASRAVKLAKRVIRVWSAPASQPAPTPGRGRRLAMRTIPGPRFASPEFPRRLVVDAPAAA